MHRLIDLVQGLTSDRIDQWIRDLGGSKIGFMERLGWSRLQTLVNRLSDPARLAQLFKVLDRKSLDILRYVYAQGGHARKEELESRFPGQQRAIDELGQNGVLFLNESLKKKMGWLVYSFPLEVAVHLPKKGVSRRTLGDLLLSQKEQAIRLISTFHKLNPNGGSVVSRVLALRDKLLDRQNLPDLLDQLPRDVREVFKSALSHGGVLRSQELPRALQKAAIFDPDMLSRWEKTPLHHLYLAGFLFPDRPYQPTRFVVPVDLMDLIQDPAPVPTGPLTVAAEGPLHLRSFGLRLWGDLRLLFASLESQKIRVTQKGLPEKKALNQLMETLGVVDPHYGEFLFVVGLPHFKLTGSPTAYMRNMVKDWLETDFYQESSEHRVQPGGYLDEALPTQRRLVMDALGFLPVEQWVALPKFIQRVETSEWKQIDEPDQEFGYYGQPKISNREVLLNILVEPLAWLGLIEIGLRREFNMKPEITHVRLTRWGHFFLENAPGEFPELVSPAAESHFTVMPQLEIHAPPGLDIKLLVELLKFSALTGPQTVTLSALTVADSFVKGMTSAKIVEFLKKHSRTGVPEPVTRLFDDMDRRYGQIEVGSANTYVSLKDPSLLVGLANARSLAKFSPRPVGNNVILFDNTDPLTLLSALRKLGHFPVVGGVKS
ncbi:MAG: helicase-associated domain-containing protein [Elusimicrobia bacterium]|nr:helicase-associated domain-containing protein [Elusimicrobiota bacterium]MBP9128452.1 helicase-associated domain-containing protein [Elusimicrobiota bacterium]